MTEMHTAEKIETIVYCYLRDRTTEGTFGALVDVAAEPSIGLLPCYRVTADGCTFIVRSVREGWSVSFGPMTGIDADIYVAAKFAIEERKGRCVWTMAQALGWTAETARQRIGGTFGS